MKTSSERNVFQANHALTKASRALETRGEPLLRLCALIVFVFASLSQTMTAARPEDKSVWWVYSKYEAALFSQCSFQTRTFDDHAGRIDLSCTEFQSPRRTVVAHRPLTDVEAATLVRLAEKADWYHGDHMVAHDPVESGLVRRFHNGMYQMFMAACCGKSDVILLVTSANPTYGPDWSPPRHELLQLLNTWDLELLRQCAQQLNGGESER